MRSGCFFVFGLLVLIAVAFAAAPAASGEARPPGVADTNPPAGEILYPLPGTWLRYSGGELRVRFTDMDGIMLSSIRVDLDGTPLTFSPPSPGTSVTVYVYVPGVAEGPHTANASASDQVGNGPTVLSWSFSIDTTSPVVAITSPSGNPVIADGSVTLAWTGSDTGSGIDHYEVRLDDGPYFRVGTATTFPFHNLSAGVHYFWAIAYDAAGNSNYYGEVAIATVPAPPPTRPPANATTQVTVVVPDQIPSWAIVLVVINAAEAAAVAWLALRRRRESPRGDAPGP